MELEAANSKGNSRQLFRIVKSMTRNFHPRLQGIQSATGENLTEAAQIANRWKGHCEDLYCDEEGKTIEQEYNVVSLAELNNLSLPLVLLTSELAQFFSYYLI